MKSHEWSKTLLRVQVDVVMSQVGSSGSPFDFLASFAGPICTSELAEKGVWARCALSAGGKRIHGVDRDGPHINITEKLTIEMIGIHGCHGLRFFW